MKKIIVALAFFFLIIACDHKSGDASSFELTDESETLDFTTALKNDRLELSDLIDSVRIISLKTSVLSSMLSDVRDVIVRSGFVYILDAYQNGSVAIFDSVGNFVKRIQSGRGPGETNMVSRISFDNIHNRLLTYQDFLINEYSEDGKYIRNNRIKYLLTDYIVTKTGIVCVQNESKTTDNFFTVFEKESFTDEEDLYTLKCKKQRYALSMDNHFIQENSNGELLICRPLDNHIYKYENGKVKVKYKFLFDELDTENVKRFMDFLLIQKENLFSFMGKYFETNNYQYFTFQNSKYPVYVYRNKNSGQIRSGYREMVDNTFIPGRIIGSYGQFFVSLLESKMIDDDIKNLIMSNPLISEVDKKKIQNFTEDDNPLIVLYRLKDIK